MYDPDSKKLLMFEASKRRASFGAAPKMQSQMPVEMPIEEMSPMLSNSANLMMSGMTGSIGHLAGGPIGPPEAYFPFVNVSSNGTVTQDTASSIDDDDLELDQEIDWVFDELIDLGAESGTASEGEDEDPSPSSDTAEPFSTPARSTNAKGEELDFLTHLQTAGVGAFRNNQRRHQLLTRGDQSHDSLTFSNGLNNGTLKGMKKDRLAHASKPITPRRKTLQQPIISSPGSPLANVGAMKRKFNGEDFVGHKRNRSAF